MSRPGMRRFNEPTLSMTLRDETAKTPSETPRLSRRFIVTGTARKRLQIAPRDSEPNSKYALMQETSSDPIASSLATPTYCGEDNYLHGLDPAPFQQSAEFAMLASL